MTEDELPHWMELPESVRQRVVERMKELYPEPEDTVKERQEMLCDLHNLAALRMVQHLGSIRQAIKAARQTAAGRSLLAAIGERRSDWQKAIEQCGRKLSEIVNDETELKRGLTVQLLVAEELRIYYARN